jgi:Phage P22-like portal protein
MTDDDAQVMPTSDDADGPPARDDDEILDEIRERRTYATRAWEDIRKEGQKDVMCLAGEVWEAMDPGGLSQRVDASRPHIACDELGQYINQVANDVRQNKRAVKVTPIGNGANDKTADFREALIRQTEYRSNAQRDVYSPIFEDALQRGYGFGRVKAQYVSDTSRNQELMLEAFPNPDVVTVDPDGAMLAPDCSKIDYAFILENYSRKKFKREFKDAQIVDFADEHLRLAPDWFQGDHLTVAEYWTIDRVPRRVVFLKADPANGVFVKDLTRVPKDSEIDDERMVPVPYVCSYLTNGVELLTKPGQKTKRQPWPGKSIPIFSCFGKVLYVQTGAGTQRRLLSMVRLARDPFMLYCYIRTCEAEAIGGVPRTTWVGYEGQFRGHETEW